MPTRLSASTATPPFDSQLLWSSVPAPAAAPGDGTGASVRSLLDAGHAALGTGNWSDALEALNTAYDLLANHDLASLGPGAPEAHDAAELFIVMGFTRFFRDELDLAEEAFDTAYAISVLSHLEQARARAANGLGIVAARRSNFGAAEQWYGEVRTRADQLGDARLVAIADTNLAILANDRGERGRALVRWGGALEHFRRAHDDRNATAVLSNIARACLEMGHRHDAAEALGEAERLAEACGDRLQQALLDVLGSECAFERGDHAAARDLASQAITGLLQLGSRDQLATAFFAKGRALRELGELAEADALFAVALRIAELCDDRELVARVEGDRARGHFAASRSRDAFRSLNRAIRLYEEIGVETAVSRVRRQLEGLEQVSMSMAQEWATRIDRHCGYADGHANAVARTAVRLAEASSIPSGEHQLVRLGALLHDAGMAVLPTELFASPRELTPASWDLVRLHAETGADAVTALDFPREVGTIVRHHHEHWDGSGYPHRLASDAIPMPARVVSVASVWHSLVNARPHRPAFSARDAREHMARMAGTALDPALVERLFGSGVLDDGPAVRPRTPPASSGLTTEERLTLALAPSYELEQRLLSGDSADLFLARQPSLERKVVVRVVARDVSDPAAAERFQREMMITARLQHPVIVPVWASGARSGLVFCVMPHMEGDSLRERLEQHGALPFADAARIAGALIDALAFAHDNGVRHGDITPENILLTPGGVMLAGAGIAHAVAASGVVPPSTFGTPAYMAPEQVLGEPAGAAADVYALALVTYEMLAGAHPLSGPATLGTHLLSVAEPLASRGVEVPPGVSEALVRAMAKAPEDRFQSVDELRLALFA